MGVGQLFKNIDSGKEGRNVGISTGLPAIDSLIYCIQRKYLYTIGADTSGGKTSFAIDVFVYNLIKNAGTRPVSILYYSFEMSSDILFAKLLSLHIYDTYGEVITYDEILSLNEPISEEKYQYIQKSKEWLFELEKKVTIYDKALSPQGIYATCKQWLKNFGQFIDVSEHKEDYIEDNPDHLKIALLDHVGLISGQGSKKERIDLTVDFFIHFRNKCSLTGVFIQQLNRNSKGMDRKTNGYELIQLDDKENTRNLTNTVIDSLIKFINFYIFFIKTNY